MFYFPPLNGNESDKSVLKCVIHKVKFYVMISKYSNTHEQRAKLFLGQRVEFRTASVKPRR